MAGVRHGGKRALSFSSGSLFCQWSWLCSRLVRSFREDNFSFYCQALSSLIPFFANNNVNHARWLPILLRDMVALEQTHSAVFREFHFGKFVVHKTHREFSGKAIDQAHEQANAVVKGDGGAISISEDSFALR